MSTDKVLDVALGALVLPAVVTSRVIFIAAGVPIWGIAVARSLVGR